MKKGLFKIVSVVMMLTMVLCLGACGAKEDSGEKKTEDKKETQIDDSKKEDKDKKDKKEKKETKAEKKKESKVDFNEIVVVDNDQCMLKITDLDPDNSMGYGLKIQMENKSPDKTYMFAVQYGSINGVKCDPYYLKEVAAGKKANDEIIFSAEELDENNVGDYTDIALSFRINDSNDWEADAVAVETVHVYPYGEDKAVKYVREAQPEDQIIVDNEYITVIVTGYEMDDIWGYTAHLYLVNKTDTSVMYSADEVSINGMMADPYYATTVGAGNTAFSSISWSTDTLSDNGITEIENIEFILNAYDNDNWDVEDFANEPVVLNP